MHTQLPDCPRITFLCLVHANRAQDKYISRTRDLAGRGVGAEGGVGGVQQDGGEMGQEVETVEKGEGGQQGGLGGGGNRR